MKIILFICFTLLRFLLFANNSTLINPFDTLNGSYKCGLETLYFDSKVKTFYLKRSIPKSKDGLVPICYDTTANGHFKIIADGVATLFNGKDYHSVKVDFKKENRFSNDTVYFKIELPIDQAFYDGRFNFEFDFVCFGRLASKDKLIKIPRSKFNQICKEEVMGLLIHDLSPYCFEEEKCYQRVYFRILDLVSINYKSNYFTISLINFNECYVERMDVQNDFIYFDKNNIYWRGKMFKKIN